jgi:hypothetical protein
MASYPVWQTPAGNLGIIQENEFFLKSLEVTDSTVGTLEFFFISGELPPGIQVVKSGTLQGVPVVSEATNVNKSYQFAVRVKNSLGLVADRTFSLTITNILPPVITPKTYNLGDFFDGTFFNFQLLTLNLNREQPLVWTIENGGLPNGVTMNSSGLISGFILPLPVEGAAGLTGYNNTRFNQFGFDNVGRYRNNSYTFTVKVFDGANYDTFTYTFTVAARGNWTADNDLDLVINDYLTIDRDNKYVPIITTAQTQLPEVRSDGNFAFQFQAIDPELDVINWSITTTAGANYDINNYDIGNFSQEPLELPDGLTLDLDSGWLYGYIPPQTEVIRTYTFEVRAFKRDRPEYISEPRRFTLSVLGDVINSVTWITPSNLGIIDNGSVSELSIQAVNSIGKKMSYSLISGESRLPQGLQLLPSGLIVGRTTFRYFSLDAGITTFDGSATTFDNTYSFSVLTKSFDDTIYQGPWAVFTDYKVNDVVEYNGVEYLCIQNHTSNNLGITSDGNKDYWTLYTSVSAIKSFTIRINNYDQIPFENLYIQALPTYDQRQTFLDIVNNTEIFPNELIYRLGDPWFGKSQNIRSLFLAGIAPSFASSYIESMGTHHYNKSITFGAIKTARALDSNFQTKYEVVYLDLTDSMINQGLGPDYIINLTNKINPWYDAEGKQYSVVYPNSFMNMDTSISSTLGFQHQGALPDWMTGTQEDGRVLGFVNAVVLAHTVPGASKLIAYRLNTQGLTFNNIDFIIDRYMLDNHLTTNYDIPTGRFLSEPETTFDTIKTPFASPLSATYAVSGIPFDNIHGKTVRSIRNLGGFDNVTTFRNGETLVFIQQEDYDTPTLRPGVVINDNQGWNRDGVNVTGYIDNLLDSTVPNQRAGIWRIRVEDSQETVFTSDFGNESVGYDNSVYDLVEEVIIPPATVSYASDFGNDFPGFDSKVYDYQIMQTNPLPRPEQIVYLDFVGGYNQHPFWTTDTTYDVGDFVLNGGVVYRCLRNHISGDVFPLDITTWQFIPRVTVNTRVQINNGTTYSQLVVFYDSAIKAEKSVPEYSLFDIESVNSQDKTRFDNYGTRFFSYRDSYAAPGTNDKYLKFPKYGVFK